MGIAAYMVFICESTMFSEVCVALQDSMTPSSIGGDTEGHTSWFQRVEASHVLIVMYFLGRYVGRATKWIDELVKLFTTSYSTHTIVCDGGHDNTPAFTTTTRLPPEKVCFRDVSSIDSEYHVETNNRDMARDMRFMKRVQIAGVPFNASNVSELMCVCSRFGHRDAAMKLFDKMLDKGAVPNAHTIVKSVSVKFFNLVVGTLGDKRIREAGPRLIDLMRDHGLSPSAAIQNRLLQAWGNLLPENILQRFLNIRSDGGNLSTWAYCHIVVAYELSDPAFALKIFDEMDELGYKADRAAYNALLVACCQLGLHDEAKHLFMQMADRALEPNAKSYVTMVKVYASSNEPKTALALFETCRDRCFKPDRFAYHHAICSCIALQRIRYAVELYRGAIHANMVLCTCTYVALSSACQKIGRIELAGKIRADLRRIRAAGAELPQTYREVEGAMWTSVPGEARYDCPISMAPDSHYISE
ncbi:unnamed protein product [Prorocentrum cordatum]|uniref:Pentacotripeptide-repeat region of PRORP domain-containing protein n=1 Tax=Prorocentrum cordatum TaxID=2364126 RepID=A0ABN9SLH0_9DINO|nr:unnamed protein product [Polarella glacialis]